MTRPPHPAWVFLRSHREGTLSAGGEISGVSFIIDGATARLVFPVHPSVLGADELVLFVPEEAPPEGPELQLLLAREDLDGDSEPADRWRAYHGEARQTRWIACEIDGARFDGNVVEPELLRLPNALRPVEARLCKRLNADRAALSAICERGARVAVREPLAVGVDPTGIDVRARFGIVHVPFDPPVFDGAEAERAVGAMLGGGA